MAHPPSYPDTGDDARERSDRGSGTSTPRWVYVFWIVGIVIVLLVVVLHVSGTIGARGH